MTDTDKRIGKLKEYTGLIPEGALVNRYFAWLAEGMKEKDPLYKSDYEPIVRAEAENRQIHRPFLSVIVRTQGRRPEMLRETLLCLMGQKDQDFEVVLIGHKTNEAQTLLVEEILDEQPSFMREKIRYFPLAYGSRTTPLNLGFAHAYGEYIAILDDDDIVMDHWVSSFKEAAQKKPGVVLHSYAVLQEWMTINTDSGVLGLRAAAAPNGIYIRRFDFFEQLRINSCPPCCLAFPSYLFQKQGLFFDESLTTTEDWDYLMRSVLIAGVGDIEEITTVYRAWTNAETSRTVHNNDEWDKNYDRIIEKIKGIPAIIPTDAQDSLMHETMKAIQDTGWPYRLQFEKRAALYMNFGGGFNQENIVFGRFASNGVRFDSRFEIPEEYAGKRISSVRFDPTEKGLITLREVTVFFEYFDGSIETRGIGRTVVNGMKKGNKVFFLKQDPWIIWDKINKPIRTVRVIGEISAELSEEMIMDFMHGMNIQNLGLLRSALSKIKRKIVSGLRRGMRHERAMH